AGVPTAVDWERIALATAGQIDQVFPAMATVTVDGTDIEICEDWSADEFAGLLLAGHLNRPTALAAARAYLDAYRECLVDETWSWADPDVTPGHIRWFLHPGLDGDDAWTWVTRPVGGDVPVTTVTPRPVGGPNPRSRTDMIT
ncbi:hypothetical protein, partial [Candidatus Frankia alpina]|uniref:hypothetical protein n=1 Tax=Candidatus Frankia alpina TaxID=2699483 RepID=UPI0013868663